MSDDYLEEIEMRMIKAEEDCAETQDLMRDFMTDPSPINRDAVCKNLGLDVSDCGV